MSKKWKYIQRTVQDTSRNFLPLEECIRSKLIPAIIGRNVSDLERRMLSLPLRYGGLGMENPVQSADSEYMASKKISEGLVELIYDQDMDVAKINKDEMKKKKTEVRKEKDGKWKEEMIAIKEGLDPRMKRYLEGAQEKGASSWLSCLPLETMGYSLNKREFRDSLCLRYGWKVTGIHTFCACGKLNEIEHSLTYPNGGYVIMHHNAARDLLMKILKQFNLVI